MRHGYTNETSGDGTAVIKRFTGPDRAARRQREYSVLDRLRGRLPVPGLLGGDESSVHMEFVDGAHGQDLIDAGHAAPVLRACGEMLRRIHHVDVADVLPAVTRGPGTVLVHGDYGPNNLLFDRRTFSVNAVLDWEWTHPGHEVEDLAWCEWIVRMHHPDHIDALDGFFDGYGWRPGWSQRRTSMLARCQALLDLCQQWTPEGVPLWQRRLDTTAEWHE